ncbi:lysophospholipase D GDPD1 [Erythrolamprus reginae]|uniref:lysophospholipase D GDPD1 n=1 Tax=Erythrolamprus reginae TaxID=121349 RepID=UPI00396CF080
MVVVVFSGRRLRRAGTAQPLGCIVRCWLFEVGLGAAMSTAFYLLSTLAVYLLTSALLLKFPGLLHRRKRHRFRCRHISHRGDCENSLQYCILTTAPPSARCPPRQGHQWRLECCASENGLLSSVFGCDGLLQPFASENRARGGQMRPCQTPFLFGRGTTGQSFSVSKAGSKHLSGQLQLPGPCVCAVNVGTDMLELDCHFTKDEQVVVTHDENLKRSTGVDANISDLKYSELPPYLCKLEVTFQKECQCEGEDKRIPLLQEVFEAFPHTPVNIDIKVNNDQLVKKVSELVRSYKREHLTVWGSASHEVVEKCQNENCHIPTLFCLRRVLLLLGLFYTGLLPFFPLVEEFLEIPMPSIILKLRESEKISKGQRFTIQLIDVLLMRKTLFDHLTARGIQVYIWVLNDDQEYKRAFDLGATGVMTDYPTKLKEFLHNYPA